MVRAAISGVLLWLVARTLNLSGLAGLLSQARWGWLVAACAVMVISRGLSVARVLVLMRAKRHPVDPKAVGRIVLGSEFFGSFLLSSVGGDGIRLYGLRRHTADTSLAVSVVLLERVIGMMALLVFGCAGALWAWSWLSDHRVVWVALVPSSAALAVVVVALSEQRTRLLLRGLSVERSRWAGKLLEWQRAVRAYRDRPKVLGGVAAISLVIQLLRIVSVYCTALALGAGVPFAYFMSFVPLILLISMLPISIGGFGIRENAFVHLFGQIGMDPLVAFSISLIAHALSMVTHMPGGLWAVWGTRRARQASASLPFDRPLRVLWLADKLGYGEQLHGIGQYYLTVLPSLQGVEVVPAVLRRTNGLAQRFVARGVQLWELPNGLRDPRMLWRLIQRIRRERIDLLHLHGDGALMIGRLAGWLTGTPAIMHQHDSMRRPWYIHLSHRLFRRLTAQLVAVSESVKEFWVTEHAVSPDRATVIPLGISPLPTPSHHELQHQLRQLRLPPTAKVVGSITRFYPVKGVRYLIEAMPAVLEAVRQAHLVLWGDGPEREALERQARALQVAGRVRFAGHHLDAARYLGLVDCFALASLTEGFPFVLLEAMTAARPIVATRVGGVPEMVRDEREALLVPPKDGQALARAIVMVLTNDELARRLGQAARQASGNYTIERHVSELRRLYETVIS